MTPLLQASLAGLPLQQGWARRSVRPFQQWRSRGSAGEGRACPPAAAAGAPGAAGGVAGGGAASHHRSAAVVGILCTYGVTEHCAMGACPPRQGPLTWLGLWRCAPLQVSHLTSVLYLGGNQSHCARHDPPALAGPAGQMVVSAEASLHPTTRQPSGISLSQGVTAHCTIPYKACPLGMAGPLGSSHDTQSRPGS